MFLVSTRSFPPELGGMQNLMEGLANALTNHGPVKVFADNHEDAIKYDQNSKLNIERISGFKIFRKYRKANLVKDFIKQNQIRACFFDHWKSIENIELDTLKKTKSFCLIHSKEINHPVGSSLNKRVLKSLEKADFIIANSKFTKELGLKLGLKDIHVINPGCNYPIAVRSSSLLEDSQYQPLSGAYSTFMLANNQKTFKDRINELKKAIRLVFASIFYRESKSHFAHTAHRTEEEKTALKSLWRGVYANKNINKGETIKTSDTFFAMPFLNGQLFSGNWKNDIIAKTDIKTNEPLLIENLKFPKVPDHLILQHFIHKIKALINESRTIIGT